MLHAIELGQRVQISDEKKLCARVICRKGWKCVSWDCVKTRISKSEATHLAHLVVLRNADITGSVTEFPVGTAITGEVWSFSAALSTNLSVA